MTSRTVHFNPRTLDFTAFEITKNAENKKKKIQRFLKNGHLIAREPLRDFIRTNTFNLTFEEAFAKTGIKINITITDTVHQKYRLCNYISTPRLYLWSAALASCSLPFVYAPNELVYKQTANFETGRQFTDGSIGCDLPLRHMSTMYNVSNLLVSQTNPYIIPFLRTSEIIPNHKRYWLYRLKEKLFEILGGEIKLRLAQLKNLNLIPKKFQLLANMCNYFSIQASFNKSFARVPRRRDHHSSNRSLRLLEPSGQSFPREYSILGQSRQNHDIL